MHVGERAAVAARGPGARRARSTTSSEARNSPTGIGRPAVVEVERDPAEQVVARDQQPALGLVQARRARARARASRGRATCRGRSRPRRRGGGRGRPRAARTCRVPRSARLLDPAPQRRLRHAALARDLDPPRERRLRIARPARSGARGAGASTARSPARLDRRRLPAVVDVGVRADEQAHVLEPQPDLLERPLEVRAASRARPCRSRRARSRRRRRAPRRCSAGRPATAAAGAAARRRGRRARRARPPPCASGLRMAADGNVRAHGRRRRAVAPLLRRAGPPRPRRDGRLLGARRRRRAGRPGDAARAGRRARLLRRAVRRGARLHVRRRRARSPRTTAARCSGAPPARSPATRLPGHRSRPAPRRAARARPLDGRRRADRAQRRVPDGCGFARQIGMLPPQRLAAPRRAMLRAFNARTRVGAEAGGHRCRSRSPTACGIVRGGVPRTMNVYLIEDDGGGVTVFDAGHQGDGARRSPRRRARSAASSASCSATATPTTAARRRACGAPVYDHPADRADARATAAAHYFDFDSSAAVRARRSTRTCSTSGTAGRSTIAGTVDGGRRRARLPRRRTSRATRRA